MNKLPLLEALCWNITDPYALSEVEMLGIYERYWRFKGILAEPSTEEIKFISYLSKKNQSYPLISVNIDKREHYEKIKSILKSIKKEIFSECEAYLGGGTLNNLDYQLYRYSSDIDFICSSLQGYRQLRKQLRQEGSSILFAQNVKNLTVEKSPQIDQYGIRFPVTIDNSTIKLEIIVENRIELESPIPSFASIPSLSIKDRFSLKLLANADRYMDKSINSRDLIDLAILRNNRVNANILEDAIAKTETIYGVKEELIKAIELFQENPDNREKCYQQLQIDRPVIIINGLDLLAQDMGLSLTTRSFIETDFSYLK